MASASLVSTNRSAMMAASRRRLPHAVVEANCEDGTHLITEAVVKVEVTVDTIEVVVVKK